MNTKDMSEITKNLGGFISKNSPTILTALAVGGVFTTVALAIKATPKAIDLIEDASVISYKYHETDEPKYEERDLTKIEVIKLTWKLYVPTLAVGAATIACIIGANHISLRRNAALASLYGLTEAAFKEYQAKVVETIGRNKETKVRDDIAADRIKNNPSKDREIIFTGKGEVLCYDSMSGRYFKSDIEQIRRVVNDFNYELRSEMFKSLNELYYELGLTDIKLGDEMGWNIEKGQLEMSYSSQINDEGVPCLVLNYEVVPKYSEYR